MSTPKIPTVIARTHELSDFVLTAVIPEKLSYDGIAFEKTFKVESCYDVGIELPIGIKVYILGNSALYTLVVDAVNDMKDLPGPPQEDLFVTIYDGTVVREKNSLPYELGLNTRIKVPEHCRFCLFKGTKLYGPNGLLILQNSTIIELAPTTKPTSATDTKSSNKPTPAVGSINKIIHDEEKENDSNKLSLEIIDLVMKIKNNILLKYLKRELLDIVEGKY